MPNKVHVLAGALGTLLAAAAFAEPYAGPPLDLLATNIQQTPYTAYVRIDSVQLARETRNSRTGRVGVITFRVQATVVEPIKGRAVANVEYLETREAPSAGPHPGARIVVSLVEGGDGVLFVPDNGYVFPATPEVLRRARKMVDPDHRTLGTSTAPEPRP